MDLLWLDTTFSVLKAQFVIAYRNGESWLVQLFHYQVVQLTKHCQANTYLYLLAQVHLNLNLDLIYEITAIINQPWSL